MNEGRRKAVEAVARILRGERRAEIPVNQTTRYRMAINRTTARAMGLTIPAAILTRAELVVG